MSSELTYYAVVKNNAIKDTMAQLYPVIQMNWKPDNLEIKVLLCDFTLSDWLKEGTYILIPETELSIH